MATEHFMDRGPLSLRKYPLADMAPGDFFRLPALYARMVSVAASKHKKGRKSFSVKRLDAETHICKREF